MNLTLSKRIIGAVIISVLVGSTSAIISSFFLMRGFDEQAQKDVEQYSLAVQSQLDTMQERPGRPPTPWPAGRMWPRPSSAGTRPTSRKWRKEILKERCRQRAHHRRQGRQGGRPRALGQGRRQRARPGEREEGSRRGGLRGCRGGHRREIFHAGRHAPQARGRDRRVRHGRGRFVLGHEVRRSHQKDLRHRVHDFSRRHARVHHHRAEGKRAIGTKMDNPR